MRFAPTPEQLALRAEARRLLAAHVDLRAQIARPGAHAPQLWKQLASAGWLGATIAEEHGGSGMSFVDLCLILEETGRALLPGPFVATVLGGALGVACFGTDEQRARLLPAVASGETICARAGSGGLTIDGDRVAGDRALVPAAGLATWLLVEPRDEPPLIVARDAFTAEPMESADLTRPMYRVTFDGRGERLARPTDQLWVLKGRVAAAAEAVGGASAVLDRSVAYAKERHQFGKPIGSFQAIKHKAADMLRSIEAARLAMWAAAWSIDNDSEDAATAASAAKALACDTFVRCAADAIQIHGGIGVTWEHDAHLYYRRALALQASHGDATEHREHVAAALITSVQESAR